MEENISGLTDKEIDEMICELEHVYAEFLAHEAPAEELNFIHRRILLLKREAELRREKDNGSKQ